MKKFCCCEPEVPDVTVNIKCACCKGNVEETTVKDSTDLNADEQPETIQENKEDDTICCCFRRKRHAKLKRAKEHVHDGTQA